MCHGRQDSEVEVFVQFLFQPTGGNDSILRHQGGHRCTAQTLHMLDQDR